MINKYSSTVNNFINKYGDEIINKLVIIRVPITKIINMIIKPFNKIPYDKYFHLSLIINDKFILEKNEIINFARYNKVFIHNGQYFPPDYSKIQHYIIKDIPQNKTIKQFLYNTQHFMGSKYFPYNGLYNNCQDFILSVLKSNNINDINAETFIKQNVEYIKKNWPTLNKIMLGFTSSAAIVSTHIF